MQGVAVVLEPITTATREVVPITVKLEVELIIVEVELIIVEVELIIFEVELVVAVVLELRREA